MDYKNAGVDIEAGYKSVELMKESVKRTMREEVLGGLGGFSGAFSAFGSVGGLFLLGAGADSRRERFRGRAGLSREPHRIGQA